MSVLAATSETIVFVKLGAVRVTNNLHCDIRDPLWCSSNQGAAALTKKDPMLISCVNSSLNLNINVLYFKNYLVESYGQITEHFWKFIPICFYASNGARGPTFKNIFSCPWPPTLIATSIYSNNQSKLLYMEGITICSITLGVKITKIWKFHIWDCKAILNLKWA